MSDAARPRVSPAHHPSDLPGLIVTFVWAFDDDADARYRLNTGGSRDARADWLRMDTTYLAARETAERIEKHFALPTIRT
jgi:hypothetical protein